jgi:hypothetical protein
MTHDEYWAMWDEACAAGLAAGKACKPVPMVVGQAVDLFSDKMVPGTESVVEDGVCGFAWVNVRPATSAFCKWWKKNIGEATGREVHRAYEGGYTVLWVGEFNQSMTRKEAYAQAFAEVLRKYGIKASAMSRLD